MVPSVDECLDGGDEILDAGEGAAADGLAGGCREARLSSSLSSELSSAHGVKQRRGGDPVTRMARMAVTAIAGRPDITVVQALRMKALTRDSVGLGTAARERNIAGRVLLRGARPRTEVVLVDDIVTTGATARESVKILHAAGVRVAAVLAIAAA